MGRGTALGRWTRVCVAATGAVALAGCGSSSKAVTSAAGTPQQQSCAAVTAVLGNGPDPGDDPVGYAEAQIKPLLTVQTSDASLHRAVTALSAAYQQFYVTNGSAAAKATVKQASARVDAICPGATS